MSNYLIFSATLLFKSKKATVLGATLSIMGLSLAGAILDNGPIRAFLIDPITLEFCMGLWLAWVFSQTADKWRDSGFASGVLGFSLLMAAPLFIAHSSTNGLAGFTRVLAWGLPAVLALLWQFKGTF